jgi:C_GCAxxG_C_C family probable redox protein
MTYERLERKAFDYYNSGFCCSEALAKTIIEEFSESPDGDAVKVASGFCGGMGSTTADVCGTLAGAVIAVGYLYGRSEPGSDIKAAATIIAEFRRQFIETFGSTNCAALLKAFGPQENRIACKQMTAKATGMLAELLRDK